MSKGTTDYILVKHYEKAPKMDESLPLCDRTTLTAEYTRKIARRAERLLRLEWKKEHKTPFILIVDNGWCIHGRAPYFIHLHQLNLNKKETEDSLKRMTEEVFNNLTEIERI